MCYRRQGKNRFGNRGVGLSTKGLSCMSAHHLVRAAKPFGRQATPASAAAALTAVLWGPAYAQPPVRHRAFTNSSSPRSKDNFEENKSDGESTGDKSRLFNASAVSAPAALAVAAVAGVVGWGASELYHREFPKAMLLDSIGSAPRYASTREMVQVWYLCLNSYQTLFSHLPFNILSSLKHHTPANQPTCIAPLPTPQPQPHHSPFSSEGAKGQANMSMY